MLMLERFGVHRVIEPKGSIPITAWKIDNRKELYADEIRLKIHTIHLEVDSFQQICSQCNYDSVKIKARIYDLVSKRGKLHNPFTNSGGILYGTIEEIGSSYDNVHHFRIGDEVIAITCLTGVPLWIQEIKDIDFYYGQISVKGYCILFNCSPLIKRPPDLAVNYVLEALDEAGSVYNIYERAIWGRRFFILGRDILSILLYSATVRKAAKGDCYVAAVLDKSSVKNLQKEEIARLVSGTVDKLYLQDIMDPIKTSQALRREEKGLFDFTIVCEDMQGTETVSVLMTKENGHIYFTSFKNNYNAAILFAESLGKEVNTYSLDRFLHGNDTFMIAILRSLKGTLEEMSRLYHKNPIHESLISPPTELLHAKEDHNDFVYISDTMQTLFRDILNIAPYDCNVIIEGESGVGKEKILDLIHKNSSRKLNPCLKVSCAVVDDRLAEIHFFGCEGDSVGCLERANTGILFLDDVGSLSMHMQTKLLRALQENCFQRVNGKEKMGLNLRVICGSETSLRKLVEQGKFREDLYYFLNIYKIDVPPLRERPEDIYCLIQSFLGQYNQKYRLHKEISPEGCEKLQQYSWPGNVLELENIIHRLVVYSAGKVIAETEVEAILHENMFDDMILGMRTSLAKQDKIDFSEIIGIQEKKLIHFALKREITTRKAADFLGISQTKLIRKKQKYGID